MLTAYEPFERTGYTEDLSVAVLRGFTRPVSQDNLSLYAEYLVVNDDPDNDIEATANSKLIPGVIYVKYKHAFDEKKLKSRIQTRPTLNSM